MDPWTSLLSPPVNGEIDLHTFRPSELDELLVEWMLECRQRGLLEVRIIHGKGRGVARERVQALLSRSPLVRSWQGAPGGNWGATVARLYAPVTDEGRVREVLGGCPRLMAVLAAVEGLGLGLWVGGGAVRNPLWHRLHGLEGEPESTAFDVLWHDPSAEPSEAEVRARLTAALPGLDWDPVNQALRPDPAGSVADALARWPETATAVAARLRGGTLELLAPLGWGDLLAMVVRRGPFISEPVYQARLESKRWRQRFPWATIYR